MAKGIRIVVNKREDKVEKDPREALAESLALVGMKRNGEIVPAFSFNTGEGRGTAPEIVPLDELVEYYDVLSAAVENGVPRGDEGGDDEPSYIPTPVLLAAQLKQGEYKTVNRDDDGDIIKGPDGKATYTSHGERVMFRSRVGRGAKTQKIRPELFSDIVDLVGSMIDQVPEMTNVWTAAVAKASAAEAAEAAAKAAADGSGDGSGDNDVVALPAE